MDDLTEDGFLGGRLRILQPRQGYRAGVDPVFLAAAVPATPGQSVLELGTGVGTAILCLARRVDGLTLAALELQPDYAELARKNALTNGIDVEIETGDLARMPAPLKSRRFDHVLMNPPYFHRDKRTQASDQGRETALSEATDLADWCGAGLRRLAPGGRLTLIQAAERLPDILALLAPQVGTIEVRPLAPRSGRTASRVIVSATRGGRAFALHPPTILHAAEAHRSDAPDYAPEVEAVLRHGAPWPWIES